MLRGKVRALLIASILPLAWPVAAPAQNGASPPVGAQPRAAQPVAAQPVASQPVAARPVAPRVTRELQSLVDWVKGRGGVASVQIYDTGRAAVWAEAAPDAALNPASTMKVLTAAVALARLGPEYRFSTGLYGEIKQGHVDPLVLRGHGDPSLRTADLWQLAQALSNLGVSSVGRILVDQARFDDQFVPPAFEQQPNEWAGFRAPVSAVAIEQNAVTLHVLPASVGQPARAWVEPPGVVSVEGSIETRKSGSGEAIQLSLEPRGADLVMRLGGHVAQGLPRLRFDRRLDDPRRAPGQALRELLRESSVEVRGEVGLGGASVKQRLVFHASEPMGELLHELGKHSDNFYAEMLFKVLGAEASALPATSQDGARVMSEWLRREGAIGPDTRVENGSGLFDANRVSAATLVAVLRAVYRDPTVYPEFAAQLSIGGVDGTLRSRFRTRDTRRLVRAKTGTLSATIALSGYVSGARGGAPIAFAFLINGIEGHTGEARQRIDRVVEAIAQDRAATER